MCVCVCVCVCVCLCHDNISLATLYSNCGNYYHVISDAYTNVSTDLVGGL